PTQVVGVKALEPEATPRAAKVLFSQEGEVRFQKAYVHQDGSILADGHSLDLYGAMLIRRNGICASAEGARWTCGQRAYMALRALLAGRPITCSFKQIGVHRRPFAQWTARIWRSFCCARAGRSSLSM